MTSTLLHFPFPLVRRTNLLGKASLILIFASVYLKDAASNWVSSSTAVIVLGAGLALGFVALPRTSSLFRVSRASASVLTLLLAAFALTLVGQGGLNLSSYYLAIPCAFVVVNLNPSLFLRLLLLHLAATLVIEVFEYFSGNYFFIYLASDGTSLDESLFGGGLDVFRAKGMFQGPLSAVAFALWMAFLFRGSVHLAAVLFFCAFFASGRLGMLTSLVLLVLRFLQNGTKSMARVLFLFVALVAIAIVLFAFADENRQFFMLNALDLGNDQNMSRIDFWFKSLTYFSNFSPVEMLVGNYGFILRREGGTENDFLRLLLDCGLIGFLMYAGALLTLLIRAFRSRDWEDILTVLLILLLMNIFPFVQSLSSGLLFWVYFFSKMNQGRKPVDSMLAAQRARRVPA